ncbi:hypothetical protein CFAM422_005484 [Trichoderma lentiforme]|uniref:Uncharacterized protein n=1 Tax=Trichoderma lentiforme TaxID=1567552 RepID=A0A9P4XHK1_9HYPO|nr:hypothetical protein CFAM422_005484 [Trichoderma lentiforme]
MVPSSKQHWLPAIRRQVRGTGTGMPMRGKYSWLLVQHDKQGRDGNRHNLENSSPSPAAAEPTQAHRGWRVRQAQVPIRRIFSAAARQVSPTLPAKFQSKYRYLVSLHRAMQNWRASLYASARLMGSSYFNSPPLP